jgi:hypothetical protein
MTKGHPPGREQFFSTSKNNPQWQKSHEWFNKPQKELTQESSSRQHMQDVNVNIIHMRIDKSHRERGECGN